MRTLTAVSASMLWVMVAITPMFTIRYLITSPARSPIFSDSCWIVSVGSSITTTAARRASSSSCCAAHPFRPLPPFLFFFLLFSACWSSVSLVVGVLGALV